MHFWMTDFIARLALVFRSSLLSSFRYTCCVCALCVCVCARARMQAGTHTEGTKIWTRTHTIPHMPTRCTHREQPPDDIMHRQSLGVIRTVTPNLSQRPRTRRLDVVFGLSHLSRQMDSECRRVCRWVRGHFCMHTCMLQARTVLRARTHTHSHTARVLACTDARRHWQIPTRASMRGGTPLATMTPMASVSEKAEM